jgi:hypothetical protein
VHDLVRVRAFVREFLRDIPYEMTTGGCQVRACEAVERLGRNGIKCEKLFITGSLQSPLDQFSAEPKRHNWVFHVAPVFLAKDERGEVALYVIDNGRVELADDWLKGMQTSIFNVLELASGDQVRPTGVEGETAEDNEAFFDFVRDQFENSVLPNFADDLELIQQEQAFQLGELNEPSKKVLERAHARLTNLAMHVVHDPTKLATPEVVSYVRKMALGEVFEASVILSELIERLPAMLLTHEQERELLSAHSNLMVAERQDELSAVSAQSLLFSLDGLEADFYAATPPRGDRGLLDFAATATSHLVTILGEVASKLPFPSLAETMITNIVFRNAFPDEGVPNTAGVSALFSRRAPNWSGHQTLSELLLVYQKLHMCGDDWYRRHERAELAKEVFRLCEQLVELSQEL